MRPRVDAIAASLGLDVGHRAVAAEAVKPDAQGDAIEAGASGELVLVRQPFVELAANRVIPKLTHQRGRYSKKKRNLRSKRLSGYYDPTPACAVHPRYER